VIDDLSTGRLENLSPVIGNPQLRVITAKVSEFEGLGDLVKGSSEIYHLAAAVGVELVIQSPIRTIQTNLHETEAILEAASATSVPLIIASTSEVYGKSEKEVFSEDDDLLIGPPTLGRWSYACSKLMDEFLALAFHAERKLPVLIARLFNTVGPRQTGRYGMVLPRFIAAARKNAPLQVYGNGKQTRCFCDVSDTVEALLRLMKTAAWGEVFNIGSTQEVAISDLAKEVIRLTESASRIEVISYEKAYARGFQDMFRRKPCTRKLLLATGFQPSTPLEGIIKRTLAKNLGA
ncbi:MAG: Nucleoside-diphosphate sugar epimerase, partial [Verrucomicrobiales bacterium]|nr:Nucleoside-diphosphate sugar epimerase [Verrucomicrobiales bacterium]